MDDSNVELSRVFIANAWGFLPRHDLIAIATDDMWLHHVAIAIELGLKAFLLRRGCTDDWNRTHLRHDIAKALNHATQRGLSVSPAFTTLAQTLAPLYQRPEFRDIDAPSLSLLSKQLARSLAAEILTAVSATA